MFFYAICRLIEIIELPKSLMPLNQFQVLEPPHQGDFSINQRNKLWARKVPE